MGSEGSTLTNYFRLRLRNYNNSSGVGFCSPKDTETDFVILGILKGKGSVLNYKETVKSLER